MIPMKTLIINGENFSDLQGFYEEINRVFTKDLAWETGHNFDALNDILYGGFGVFEEEPIILTWKNISKSKTDLGLNATKTYYENRISANGINTEHFRNKLDELKNNNGQTLFDIIVEIINRHNQIKFQQEN